VADELGINPGRLSKWRQKESSPVRFSEGLTEEQKEIRRLQKELKEVQLERGMAPMLTHVCGSKKAVSIFSGGDGIQVHKGAPVPVSRLRRCAKC
jgi:transposase-like protein